MESRRSHLLIGISLFAPPLQAQLDGRAAQEASKTATLWVGDLSGAEAYDQVRAHMHARAPCCAALWGCAPAWRSPYHWPVPTYAMVTAFLPVLVTAHPEHRFLARDGGL